MRDTVDHYDSQAPSAISAEFFNALDRDNIGIRAIWPEKIVVGGIKQLNDPCPAGMKDTYTHYGPWTAETHAEFDRLNVLGYCIYYTANDTHGTEFKDTNVTALEVVYRDYDKGEDESPVSWKLGNGEEIPPHIHYITSPGKSQSLWLIEDISAEFATRIHNNMVHFHGHDASTGGAYRLLRMPGFLNTKYPERPLVRMTICQPRLLFGSLPAAVVRKHFILGETKEKTAIAGIMHRAQSGSGGKVSNEVGGEETAPTKEKVQPTPELMEEALKLVDQTDREAWKRIALALNVTAKVTGNEKFTELGRQYAEEKTTGANYDDKAQEDLERRANPDRHDAVNFATVFYYAKPGGFDQHKAQYEILRRRYEESKGDDRKAAAIEIAKYAARRDVLEFINRAYLNTLFSHMSQDASIKLKTIKAAFDERRSEVRAEGGIAGDELGADQSVDTYMAQKTYKIDKMLAGPQGFFFYGFEQDGLWTRVSRQLINQLVTKEADNLDPTGDARLRDDKGNAEFTPVLEARTETTITRIATMVNTLAHVEGLAMDCGPEFAVNCPNGEITWVPETLQFELLPHNPLHRRTTQIPVPYDPDADAPTFKRMLHNCFDGDEDAEDKRTALLEAIGYSLFPTTRFERFWIPYGKQGSGKSTLLKLLSMLLGNRNISAVAPDGLGDKFMRAQLHGKLANISSEMPKGMALPDDVIKRIASGDADEAQFKHKDPFTLRPFATLWMVANELPSFRDHSNAFIIRAMLLGFNRSFRGTDDQIFGLDQKLAGELPGILNMALKAFGTALFMDALTEPQSSKDAKAKWELATNSAARFVDEECITAQHEDFAKTEGEATETPLIYSRYRYWCDGEGVSRRLERTGFTQALLNMGFEATKIDKNTKRAIKGLKLRNGVDHASVQS